MAMATTSTLAVVEQGGRFLLVQETKAHVAGLYSLPGGGIEQGESPEDTVVREVLEETGYHVQVERVVGVYYRYKQDVAANPNVGFVFACSLQGGELTTSEAHPEVAWFTFEEIKQLEADKRLRTPHLVGIIQRSIDETGFDRQVVTTVFDESFGQGVVLRQ